MNVKPQITTAFAFLTALALSAAAGPLDGWRAGDPATENTAFEKEYGSPAQLFARIRDQKETTQSLIRDRESLRRDNQSSLNRRAFRDNSDRQYWSDRFRESADSIKESRREERRLQADYDKWIRVRKQMQSLSARTNASERSVGSSHGVSFKPLLVPLTISFDSKDGLTLTCSGKIPTPIGVFEIYKNVSFPEKKTLTVVMGDKKHIYDLHDQAFKVSLPNDLDGKSKIEYDGQGNIVVVIPRPVARPVK